MHTNRHRRVWRRLAALAVGTLATTGLVDVTTSAAAPAPPTFAANPTQSRVGLTVRVKSTTPCPVPVGAGSWVADVHFRQGTTDYRVPHGRTFVTDTAGNWAGDLAVPSVLIPGNAQILATCADAKPGVLDKVVYAPTAFKVLADDVAGWVVAADPSRASYAPPLAQQFNSTQGLNVVRRDAPGTYRVAFPGLASPAGAATGSRGVAHVTPFGKEPARCVVTSYAPIGNDEEVRIRCYALASATPKDVPFSVTFSRPRVGSGGFVAFVRNDRPLARGTSYTPAISDQINLAGGIQRGRAVVGRDFIGSPYVVFPGAMDGGRLDVGGIAVTALGGAAVACTVGSQFRDAHNLRIHVPCWDSTGAAVDSPFLLSVSSRSPLAPTANATYAYHYSAARTASYPFNFVADTAYTGPAYHTTDTPDGHLRVLIPGAASDSRSGVAHAVGYEPGSIMIHCQPASWSRLGSDVLVDLYCVNRLGADPWINRPDLLAVTLWYDNQRGT